MRGWTQIAGAIVMVAALSGHPVSAQELIDGTSPEAVVDILKGFGSARLDANQTTGNPQISGRSDGKAYEVFFYGCKDKKDCGSIQFWAYWDGTPELSKVNEWNKNTRYGKVYLDQDEDLVLEFDINLLYGVHPKTVEDSADVWVRLMTKVQNEILQ